MIAPLESRAVGIAVESAVRSLAMATVVWGAIRLFRLRNLPAQKLAWMLVLALSCAMPGLLLLESAHPNAVPSVRFAPAGRALASLGAGYAHFAHRVEALRSVVEAASTAPQTSAQAEAQPSLRTDATAAPADNAVSSNIYASQDAVSSDDSNISDTPEVMLTTEPTHPAKRWHLAPLARYILPAYLAVCAVLLLRVILGLVLAARLWHQAERASAILDPYAIIRISSRIESPVTIGSGILLPASSTTWDRRRLQMVLAHEKAHIRQGDFYLQLVASIYAALTWASPLGWLLKRHLAELGEAVSDRAALDKTATVSTTDYAELLLEFASLPRHGFARAAAGVGMARPSSVQGRIERVLNERAFAAAFTGGRISALAAAVLVPCALLMAVSGRRVHAAEVQQATTIPQPAQAAAPAPQAITIEPSPAPEPAATATPATAITVQPTPAAAPAPRAITLAVPAPAAAPAPAPRPAAAPSALNITALTSSAVGLSQTLNSSLQSTALALSSQPALATGLTLSMQSSSPSNSASTGSSSSTSTATGQGSSSAPSSSQSVTNSESHTYSVDSDSDDEEDHDHNGHRSTSVLMLNGPNNSFAIVQGDSKVHGEGTEGSAFEKARAQTPGDMMWFERDGKSYVITDPATIDAGISQWKAARGFFNDYSFTRANQDWSRQLAKINTMRLDIQAPQISQAEIQKQIAEAQKSLAKIQADFPQDKNGMLTPEQNAEIQREINEAVRTLTRLEADGTLSRQIRIQVDDQMRKQMADSREAMEKARESMRQARIEANKQSAQQMQSFFDQALRDGKAHPVQ